MFSAFQDVKLLPCWVAPRYCTPAARKAVRELGWSSSGTRVEPHKMEALDTVVGICGIKTGHSEHEIRLLKWTCMLIDRMLPGAYHSLKCDLYLEAQITSLYIITINQGVWTCQQMRLFQNIRWFIWHPGTEGGTKARILGCVAGRWHAVDCIDSLLHRVSLWDCSFAQNIHGQQHTLQVSVPQLPIFLQEIHRELEREVAKYLSKEDALVLGMGQDT